MGKGDIRTRKGKIINGTFGVARPTSQSKGAHHQTESKIKPPKTAAKAAPKTVPKPVSKPTPKAVAKTEEKKTTKKPTIKKETKAKDSK